MGVVRVSRTRCLALNQLGNCSFDMSRDSSRRSGLIRANSTYGQQKTVSQFVTALKRCTKLRDLGCGKRLHQDAVAGDLHTDRYVAASLITMYGKCRSMSLAQEVFDGLIQRDVVAWTSLILGYVQNGKCLVAMDLFSNMDCEPNSVTFVAVLKACAGLATEKESLKQFCLEKGISVHRQLKSRGFDADIVVASALIDMYSKCGSMQRARRIFDRMISKNVVTWTSLILGYVQNGESSTAMDLFSQMDCQPDSFAYVAALKSCAGLASGEESDKDLCLGMGATLHKQVKDRGFDSNLFVANALLDMYSKCGSMERCRDVFERMVSKDVVSWNSFILGYVQNGLGLVAIDLFDSMDCEPSSATYVVVLQACGGLAVQEESQKCFYLQKGISIHKTLGGRGLDSELAVGTTLVDMYGKCGSMQRARQVFDKIVCKDIAIWNALILGYLQNGEALAALDSFACMDCEPDCLTYVTALKACEQGLEKQAYLERGILIHKQIKDSGCESNTFVANTLVDLYSKCSSMDRARQVFDKIITKDVVSWTTLILGYVQNKESLVAMELFASMNCEPNSLTYVAALMACGSIGALAAGQKIHARVCKLGIEEDQGVATTLVDFYGKCGSMSRAEELFNNMHSPDTASWNSLIAGYGSDGNSSQMFSLANKMCESGLRMDSITFTSILRACSHTGLVEEGKRYFDSMSEYGVCPTLDHYNCMVDMLSRANRLQEALALVKNMPVEANSVTWKNLLGGCWKWKDSQVGKVAFDALAALGTTDPADYVLMSNIYMWGDRELRREENQSLCEE